MNVSHVLLRVRHGARALTAPGLRCAVLAILLVLGISATSAHTQTALASLTKPERTRVEAMLTDELQRIVNAQKRIEGQGKHVTVSVRFDPHTEMVIVDLSKTYVPRFYGAEMEDLLHELHLGASDLLMEVIRIQGVEFRYDGKDIYHYFPEERPQEWRPASVKKDAMAPTNAAATIVVAAGHGVYFHHLYKDWRPQRDPYNGITEDFITPAYANELALWMSARSGATINFPRSSSTTTTHPLSGRTWWEMAARYHLQALYPDNPEIWNTKKGNKTNPLREYDEDINSRPLFARHISANTLIHLHTNGLPSNPAATGTRLFYHTGRDADRLLGDSILCYMKELIQAREPYTNYLVPSQSNSATNNGENTLATMPSVIVEVGFHTNPSDALALQDPVFRTAAMKGVEKGYRLHTEGEPCTPFAITNIPDSTGMQGESFPVEVNYEGYPQFAVKAKIEIVSCPSGYSCNGGEVTYADSVPSPLRYTFACRVSGLPTATTRLRTTLTDADGVKTDPVEHNITCVRPAGLTPGTDAADGQPMSMGQG